MLSDNDKLMIILTSIRNYSKGKDIYTLITEEACRIILLNVNEKITTQDIYDVIVDCFDLYNSFITEKNMDLPLIPNGAYDLVLAYLNNLLEELE